MSQLARLDFDERDGVVIATIAGELDLSNVHDVGDALRAAVPGSSAGLVLDLSKLHHIDSAGVRTLFDLRTRLVTAHQGIAAVVPPDAPIRVVLELAAVPAAVPLFAELEAAVSAVAASA